VDSEKLLRALDEHAATPLPVLIQVNVSGEGSKSGVAPDEAAVLIEAANQCGKVEVHGLMTLPPFTPDPEKARVHFAALRELRDRLQNETGTPLPELSMGMSHDFEVAIEEGATYIRVGSDIFGERG
jgi:pyridoxal phosphate enzyme (YggS family)